MIMIITNRLLSNSMKKNHTFSIHHQKTMTGTHKAFHDLSGPTLFFTKRETIVHIERCGGFPNYSK